VIISDSVRLSRLAMQLLGVYWFMKAKCWVFRYRLRRHIDTRARMWAAAHCASRSSETRHEYRGVRLTGKKDTASEPRDRRCERGKWWWRHTVRCGKTLCCSSFRSFCKVFRLVLRPLRHMTLLAAYCLWHMITSSYGVATISRLLKIISLFCKRAQ